MTLSLTESAVKRIENLIAKEEGAPGLRTVGLRVGLRNAGCSGMTYTFDLAKAVGPDEEVIEQGQVKIIMSHNDRAYFEGATLDYARTGLKEGFKFINPNEQAACGCGESVTFRA